MITTSSVGVRVSLTLTEAGQPLDLSDFTVAKELLFRPPDGVLITKTAIPGENLGELVYVTEAGFWDDQNGPWRVRAHVKASDALEYLSDWARFVVSL